MSERETKAHKEPDQPARVIEANNPYLDLPLLEYCIRHVSEPLAPPADATGHAQD